MLDKNNLEQLKASVRHNCHISDARYAGNYTLCIYLLKMREYYRWEKAIPYSEKLSNDDIGDWLTEREAYWDDIEDLPFRELKADDQQAFSCYDSETLNPLLEENKLVYSGGYGHYGKPVFFLADLESKTRFDDYTLYICGHEHARELAAPPGMSHNQTVFIRKESLKRFIWEKVEESHWYSKDNPLARALGHYDFTSAPEQSLEQMTSLEADTVLYHEIGEIQASRLLGDEWESMLMQMPRSQAEFMARAIKDHMADALSTLPRLVENNDASQIHFYFANLSGMRREIFPGLMEIYHAWKDSGNAALISDISSRSLEHWLSLAKTMLGEFAERGTGDLANLETLVRKNVLA